MRLRRLPAVLAAVAAALLLLGSSVLALINPNFTPNDLVRQSDLIMVVRLKPADKEGQVHTTVLECLRGKKPEKPPVIDLSITVHEEQATSVKKTITALAEEPALIFIGRDEDGNDAGFLHLGGRWVRMDEAPDTKGLWDMDEIDVKMEGTWAGGTDMLLKMIRLLVKCPDVSVPVTEEARWSEQIKAGRVEGRISDVQAVDLDGKGRYVIHVSSTAGDRLYKYNPKEATFGDFTAGAKLGAKSRAAAWGDFNADGRLDLASADGAGVSLWLQAADGTFAAAAKPVHAVEKCLGLAVVDAGAAGRPGILVSSAGAPVLLVPGEGGAFSARELKSDATAAAELGQAGRCLVADFDSDRKPDVLRTAARGSLFYKGEGKGAFAAGVKCPVALGPGRAGGYVGDWDQDGMLDVFCGAEDRCRLWHNRGAGKDGKTRFFDMLGISGEIAYISKPGGFGGQVCDVNNDGLQDFLIIYQKMAPQIFFNRGFRSTGHAHVMDLAEQNLLPEAGKGQQAGTVADVTDDGAQDMVVALADGDVWVFPRELTSEWALCLRVALPLGKGFAGPLTVTGSVEERGLGAWNVVPGTSEAFFGRRDGDEVTVEWQLPGGKPQKKTLEVEDKPVRMVIGAGE
jgi:hypothetical protein